MVVYDVATYYTDDLVRAAYPYKDKYEHMFFISKDNYYDRRNHNRIGTRRSDILNWFKLYTFIGCYLYKVSFETMKIRAYPYPAYPFQQTNWYYYRSDIAIMQGTRCCDVIGGHNGWSPQRALQDKYFYYPERYKRGLHINSDGSEYGILGTCWNAWDRTDQQGTRFALLVLEVLFINFHIYILVV